MSILRVGDEHRINELSLLPGGDEVTVTYGSGESRVYDKVKNPRRYIDALLARRNNGIAQIKVNGETVWNRA